MLFPSEGLKFSRFAPERSFGCNKKVGASLVASFSPVGRWTNTF